MEEENNADEKDALVEGINEALPRTVPSRPVPLKMETTRRSVEVPRRKMEMATKAAEYEGRNTEYSCKLVFRNVVIVVFVTGMTSAARSEQDNERVS